MARPASGATPGHVGVPEARRLRQARVAVAVVFFIMGSLFGNWAPRIPAVKDHVQAGTGALGLALLGIAVGSLVFRPVAGQLVVRFGSAVVTWVGVVSSCLMLLLPGLAGDIVTLGFGLFGFGAAMAILDVAMNAHGLTVQKLFGRPIIASFHAIWSVGALTGAVTGGLAAAGGLSPLVHFALVAVVLGGAGLVALSRLLPSAVDAAPRTATSERWARLPGGRRGILYLLGATGLCTMVGEGAAADWSAIYLRHVLGTSAGAAASGYAAYSIAKAAGGFVVDRLVGRWGGHRVVMWAVTFAGSGFALALLIGHPVAAVCGLAVLGFGLAAVNPVLFSSAGQLGGDKAGPAIAVVSMLSSSGLLIGPPIIGFAAEAVGLPPALGLVSVLALVAVGLTRVAKQPQKSLST